MCRRCQAEPARPRRRVCIRCSLAERLDHLLDDGTGRTNPLLVELARSRLPIVTPHYRDYPGVVVRLATPPDQLRELLVEASRLVAPKRLVRRFDEV